MRKIVTLVYALIVTSCLAQAPISDSTRLPREPKSYGACIMRDSSVNGINENERFAMHSVMKFPQALYVADYLNRKGLNLDDTMQNCWNCLSDRATTMRVNSFSSIAASPKQ